MTIYRGPGGSGDATNDATVTAVAAYAAQAATSATNAANSAATSGTSATNSANSASSAAASASAAANSASQAASSQSDAATSATTAANSATEAGTQATNSTTQANNAANSATAAATSASTATTKAAEAETYAIRAETAETNAETAYANTLAIYGDTTDVANAVASANTAASNAATSASQAAASANDASDEATQAGIYAGQAASSASAAANSAANSQAAVGDALALYGSAAALQTAVTNAQTSATQSANSATASSASSSAAQTSANAAATSATNAANSATQAANSAASAAAIVTGVASNRPSIRPSLLLDFQYTKQLDPRITFSRPTTATYYDGKTVVKAEENLFSYSQEFDNAAWTKRSGTTITANTVVAPDGTTTADTINEGTASASSHDIYRSGYYASAGTYTFSCYAKNVDGQYLSLALNAGATPYAGVIFDLSTGTIANSAASGWTLVNATITDSGNGWYRCSFIVTTTTGGGLNIAMSNSTTISSYGLPATYTGTSRSIYLWGAQLEQRSTVTAYTPTTTAPITNYIPALQTAVSNDARFDHDPVTGESKGLLIEEQRTNLLTYSDQFDNAAWVKVRANISVNVVIAPDGTLTGDKVYDDTTASNTHRLIQSVSTSATAYTISVYAKAAERSWIKVISSPLTGVNFDLASGTVGTANSGNTGVITAVGNGWYKCSVTFTSAGGAITPGIELATGNNVTSYTGDGYSGLYIWGAQLEAGSFPTSYIPTIASQVTRSADSASMTGSNFSSWYRTDEGTIYCEAGSNMLPATSQSSFVPYSISDGSTINVIAIRSATGYSPNRVFPLVAYNNTNVFTGEGSGYITTPILNAKIALAYKLNDFANSFNGAAPYTDSSGNVPVASKLDIGKYGSFFNGTIKRIAYYPQRLSNTELQGLTS